MALCKGKGQGMVVLCLLFSPKLLMQLAWVTFLFEEEIHLIACRRTRPAAGRLRHIKTAQAHTFNEIFKFFTASV